MKITFLSTLDAYWGGSEVLWVGGAKQMIQQGHQVQVAIYARNQYHPELEELISTAYSVHYITSMKTVGKKTLAHRAYYRIKRKLNPRFNVRGILDFNPELLFVNQPATYEGLFHPDINLLLNNYRGKLMFLTHGNFEHIILPFQQLIEARKFFTKAHHLFFVSNRCKQAVEHELAMYIENSTIVDNPLNIQDHSYIPFPIIEDTVCFASVARLDATCKGQDLLLQVLSPGEWKNRKWILNLYGTGDDLDYLKALTKHYNIEEKVFFHGHVSNIQEIWAKNHILIMPSFAEGKPISLAEAMICGRTAIVTNVAGNSELIKDGFTGYLIEAPTPTLIHQTMERAWEQRQEWELLGKTARAYALQNYDLAPIESLVKHILKHA